MGYVQFLAWVAKQGLKSKVLQKYLNTAWQEATKGGKVILKTQFPKILNKAKEYYEGFKRAGLEVVKTIKVPEQTKNILNSKVARANDDSVDKNNLRDFTIIIKLKAITGTNE